MIARTTLDLRISLREWLQLVVFGSVILYFGRNIFIPLSFAVLISFVLYPVCATLERKGVSRLVAIVIGMMLLLIVGMALVWLLVSQFTAFLNEWPSLQVKLLQSWEQLRQFAAESFNISRDKQNDLINKLANESTGTILGVVRSTLSFSAFSGVLLVLVPIYSVLLLYYRHYWVSILYRLFPSERKESMRHMISMTIKTYFNFIKGMGVVYLVVGILNSIGLLILGVPHAILFGFITSILTFIPYVGILVGSLLPITMAWVTFDSVWYPVGIVGVFAFVQYLEANVIFPLAVSSRLNVNTLVMLISIFLGGLLWGVAGMILFVPFVGILKLVADHNPKWKTLSMILGTSTV